MFRWADTKAAEDAAKPPAPPPPDPRAAMLKWFYDPNQQEVGSQFAIVAAWMLNAIPAGPEATVAMRKLLEAKDAAIRAAIEGAAKRKPETEPKLDK